MIRVRALAAGDGPAYQALRLQALQTDPQAFAERHEDAVLESRWVTERRLVNTSRQFTLGADAAAGCGDELCGFVSFACGRRDHGTLFGMYVAPRWRRSGIGRALLDGVISRCRGMPDLECIDLFVTVDNVPALALYRGTGFRDHDTAQPGLSSMSALQFMLRT